MILEISSSNSPTILLVNVYNDDNNTAASLLNDIHFPNLPTLITGDFNTRHDLWSTKKRGPQNSAKAEQLVEWFSHNDFTLLNKKGEVTYFRKDTQSVLDLTWANHRLIRSGRLANWWIREDLVFGSDHIPISWEILHSHDDTDTPSQNPFVFKEDNKEAWQTEFLTCLSRLFPRTLLSLEVLSRDQLNSAVQALTSSLTQASETTTKRAQFHPKASPWFSTKIGNALANLRHARKACARHKGYWARSHSYKADQAEYINCCKILAKLIRKVKKDWAMEFAANVETKDVWKLTNWYKGSRRHHSPPLVRPDGRRAVTPEDKCDLLKETFFSSPPPLNRSETAADSHSPHPSTREFVEVTRDEVERALRSTSNTSAPGPMGVSYRALKWAWAVAAPEILLVLKWSLSLGTHHCQWKSAITVVIPKPNKPSYSNPRAYRPIQLLECLGKLLEKIVAKRITFNVGKFELVPFEQFGGRSAASCTDAGLSLVHDVELAWKHGKVASFLAIDIKGFFDNVNHRRMVKVLWEAGFPLPVVRWVESFLSNRSASIRLDNYSSPMTPIDIGIPQGSPCSPVLSILYSAALIIAIRDHRFLHTPIGIPTSPRSYVDDLGLLAISDSLEDNVATLRKGLLVVTRKLRSIGMTIDTSKLEIQHFSRRRKDNVAPTLRITLNGEAIAVTPTATMRWLGIYLDRKLTFRDHVRIMANRTSSVVNGLRCLANTVRGLSQSNLRLLYRTCAFPVLSYASVIWFREDKRQKGLLKVMDTAQNRALRLICGAFRTTQTHALRTLAHTPPVVHLLRRLSETAAARFAKLPTLSPVIQRLPTVWRDGEYPTTPTPFSTPFSLTNTNPAKHTIIEHLAHISSHKTERLDPFHSDNAPFHTTASSFPCLSITSTPCKPDERPALKSALNRQLLTARNDPSTLQIYCDGSRMRRNGGKKRTGYGIVGYYMGRKVFTIAIGLGPRATVYDAELFALAHASSKAAAFVLGKPHIGEVLLFSDSSTALSSVFDPSTHPGQRCSLLFRKNVKEMFAKHASLRISARWSPGHCGIIGNEQADTLAKQGSKLTSMIGEATYSHLKHRARMRAQLLWRRQWVNDSPKTGSFAMADVIPPSIAPNAIFRSTPRELFGRVTQTVTGHGYTGEYYQRFVPTESPWCSCTDETTDPTLQTRHHIICECPRYEPFRNILRKNHPNLHAHNFSLRPLFDPRNGLHDLIRFMHKSGAFTKTGAPRPDPDPD